MPNPEVKQGNADAHRQQEEQTTEPDGGEVEVEASGGDDPDPDDPGDGGNGTAQSHGGDDDDSGRLGGVLTNKKVIIALVAVAIIGLYLASRQSPGGGSGNVSRGEGNQAPNPDQTTDSLDNLEDDLQGVEGSTESIPQDRNDPLAADGYVLENTSIFPSISGREDRGGL